MNVRQKSFRIYLPIAVVFGSLSYCAPYVLKDVFGDDQQIIRTAVLDGILIFVCIACFLWQIKKFAKGIGSFSMPVAILIVFMGMSLFLSAGKQVATPYLCDLQVKAFEKHAAEAWKNYHMMVCGGGCFVDWEVYLSFLFNTKDS